jgi:hypothetical protein
MNIHTIGIDLGKTSFHLAGLNERGEVHPLPVGVLRWIRAPELPGGDEVPQECDPSQDLRSA